MSRVVLRLLFADEGAFHHEKVTVDGDALERYDRLIDALREEPTILKSTYIDVERLVSASFDDGDDD